MVVSVRLPSTEVLARRVVTKLGPDELDAFDIVSGPYLKDPLGAERRLIRKSDEPLGSDLTVAGIVTPVVTLVCATVISTVQQEMRKDTARLTRRMWRRISRWPRRSVGVANSQWTKPQLENLRRVTVSKAMSLGWKKRDAENLADAIIGMLVVNGD